MSFLCGWILGAMGNTTSAQPTSAVAFANPPPETIVEVREVRVEVPAEVIKEVPVEVRVEVPVERIVEKVVQKPAPNVTLKDFESVEKINEIFGRVNIFAASGACYYVSQLLSDFARDAGYRSPVYIMGPAGGVLPDLSPMSTPQSGTCRQRGCSG